MMDDKQLITFQMPAVNLFGEGCSNEVGIRLQNLGLKKPLLVTDEGLHKAGLSKKIASIIKDAGIDVAIFPKAEPNPTEKNVEDGLKSYEQEGCDSIVTLGGGSSHDAGKGIALVAANGGEIHDYEGVNISKKPMVPMIAINTTAGTGSELTKFTIITDSKRKVKMAIIDQHVTPTLSINDPVLMMGMPPGLTAATGLDALTHAVEAYVSTDATPITDALAIQAMRIIPIFLPRAVANGADMEARDKMAYAQSLAGLAFNNAGLGYVHAIAHQFGGFYNFPHGVCNAILLPHVCHFNLIARTERYADIAAFLGENIEGLSDYDAAQIGIETIERLGFELGIPSGFKEMGAKESDIRTLAENAMKDASGLTNPRKPKLEEVEQIIKNAM